MKVYRLYTERRNVKWICQEISEVFGGFTIYKTIGFWQGKRENSMCIEVMTNERHAEHWFKHVLRLKIMGYCKQDYVLITKSEVEVI